MQLRTHHIRNFVLGVAFISTLTACSGDSGGIYSGGQSWNLFEAQQTGMMVVDADQKPLAHAKILIGNALDTPFAGNYLVTDAQGQVAVPEAWTTPEPVTIEAPGYVRATYFAQAPGVRTFQLRKKMSTATTQYEVKGKTLGHTIADKDGFVDFGLVMPALTRKDFLSFNIDSVISPQSDVISILGYEADIPSNITLPRQKESYILPVTIEKPDFRIYFDTPGVQKVYAARGRFPFKEVVKELRDKAPFYKLVNYFTIQGGGVKDVNVNKDSIGMDLSVKDFDFKTKVTVTAPAFRGDETMMVFGVSHINEFMFPTDVKVLQPSQKMAVSMLDAKGSVISVLKRIEDLESDASGSDRLSAVLMAAGSGVAPQFLPLMADPALAGNGDLLVPKVNSINGVNPLATYGILSVIQEKIQGKDKVQVNNTYWEMYAPRWAEVVSLPKWPEADALAGKRHWEVNLIGSNLVSDVDLGPAMINNATHVTHTSLDF